MTNPTFLAQTPNLITERGDYIIKGLRAGYNYCLWLSGDFDSCTVLPKWIDSRDNEVAFASLSAFTGPGIYPFIGPPSGQLGLVFGGSGSCDVLVEVTKELPWPT